MEYCSSCLRPINGWLVCPGCGAYAPSITPPPRADHSTAVTPTATSDGYRPEEFSSGAPYSGALPPQAGPVGTGAPGLALGDSPAYAPVADSPSGAGYAARPGQGRAARRRQMAHWKKHRRRAAAATAVALIGGGLTVSAVQNASTNGSATAESAPESLAPVADPTSAVPSNPIVWQASTHAAATPSAQPTTPRAVRSTATTHPDAVTTTRATRVSSPSQSTTPPSTHGSVTSSYTPSTVTSQTSASASATSSPAAATSTPSPTASTTSPTHLCLLILCVG
jgi:hypothetical protein